MPQFAAFPKAFMGPLCKDGLMTLRQWAGLAASLGLDGRDQLRESVAFVRAEIRQHWPEAAR